MREKIKTILDEVQKVILGKEEVVEKVLMAVLADGHVLLDDVPGVGKTTLAVALSRALGLEYQRVQFTPDVLPSDIVGFSLYDRATGDFRYMPGAVNRANLLLNAKLSIAMEVDGHRADLTLMKTQRTLAALRGKTEVSKEEVRDVAQMVFLHRTRMLPFEASRKLDMDRINSIIDGENV